MKTTMKTTMKTIAVITLLLVLALGAFGQTDPTQLTLPTFIAGGAAFNQIGTPKVNLWGTALYPVVSSAGVYTSTSIDLIPVQLTNAATNKPYWSFQTQVRQGFHKLVYGKPDQSKFLFAVGGDGGAGFSQASPNGVNVSFAGALTGTAIWAIAPKWGLVVPIRGMYSNLTNTWSFVPEVGLYYRP